MQYRIVFVAALSATGALARPAVRRQDQTNQPNNQPGNQDTPEGGFMDIDFNQYQCPQNAAQSGAQKLNINLLGQSELSIPTDVFSDDGKFVLCQAQSDDFTQIAIKLDDNVPNKDLRCAVADQDGKMIGAVRGANSDFTFSDGGEAKPWDFLLTDPKGVKISKVVCDPAFKKIEADQLAKEQEVKVLLREMAGDDPSKATTIGPFKGPFAGDQAVEEEALDVDKSKTFATLEVSVGRLVNPQTLRCAAAVDDDSFRIGKRGANIDTTFSDAGKGEWTFSKRNGDAKPTTGLSQIVCDKDFKQNNFASPAPATQQPGNQDPNNQDPNNQDPNNQMPNEQMPNEQQDNTQQVNNQ